MASKTRVDGGVPSAKFRVDGGKQTAPFRQNGGKPPTTQFTGDPLGRKGFNGAYGQGGGIKPMSTQKRLARGVAGRGR